MTFFAGQVPTADELNDAVEIGKMLLDVTATTDSSSWTTSTKVLTNLTGSFTARAGAKYKIRIDASVSITGTAYATLGAVFKQGGAAVATDTLCGSGTTIANVTGGIFRVGLDGTFTAGVAGTYGVACVGWFAIGSATAQLDGDASHAINRITVERVA
jgi:hypothetical protein